MTFRVLWTIEAEDDLARAWTAATDRDGISKACHQFERLLVQRPLDVGESRSRGRRVGFQQPLGFSFKVFDDEAVVLVLHVWRFKTKYDNET